MATSPMYDVNAVFAEPHPFAPGGWGYASGTAAAPGYPSQPMAAPVYHPAAPMGQPVASQPMVRRTSASRPVATPQPAMAMTGGSPWYIDVALGYVVVSDADLSTGALNGELSADAGFGGSFALGYQWKENVRFDLELAYRSNDLDRVTVGGFGFVGTADVEGTVSTLAAMLNGYYDIELGWPVTPYIGAGLGMAQVTVDSKTLSTDDSATVLAYQGSLGVLYEITPQITARFGYRLFVTADPEIKNTEGEYTANSIDVGLIYRF